MILNKIVLLAGFTARSQAYVQAMQNYGFAPEYTILFGPERPILPGQVEMHSTSDLRSDLFYPDLSIPLKQSIKQKQWQFESIDCINVNNEMIRSVLLKLSPDLVIYSGYGSQLVKPFLLDTKIPFLHMHSGWLPEYKGSTTLYYSWIAEQNCAVSAIYLLPGIDEGPILLRKKYPLPPSGIDPDYIYDCSIRADLLIDIIGKIKKDKKNIDAKPQNDTGSIYYVIHPVLKHLARLSKKY